jgi:hypothetical protein
MPLKLLVQHYSYHPNFFNDYRRWDLRFPALVTRQDVITHAKSVNVPILVVFTGYFTETSMPFLFDIGYKKAQQKFHLHVDLILVKSLQRHLQMIHYYQPLTRKLHSFLFPMRL